MSQQSDHLPPSSTRGSLCAWPPGRSLPAALFRTDADRRGDCDVAGSDVIEGSLPQVGQAERKTHNGTLRATLISMTVGLGSVLGFGAKNVEAVTVAVDHNSNPALFVGENARAPSFYDPGANSVVAGAFIGTGGRVDNLSAVFSFDNSNNTPNFQPTKDNIDIRFGYHPDSNALILDPYIEAPLQPNFLYIFDEPGNPDWNIPIGTDPNGNRLYRLIFDVSFLQIVTHLGTEQFVSLMVDGQNIVNGTIPFMQFSNNGPGSIGTNVDWFATEALGGIGPAQFTDLNSVYRNGTYRVVLDSPSGGGNGPITPEPGTVFGLAMGFGALALRRRGPKRG